MGESFQARFCRHFNVPPEHYTEAVLKRTFYFQARCLSAVIALFAADFFSADRDFVNNVGRLTQRRDFQNEGQEFFDHPDNLRFTRRVLRLRVSTERLSRLFLRVWRETGGSNPPLELPAESHERSES